MPQGHKAKTGTLSASYILWLTIGQDMPQADDPGRKYGTGLNPAIWQFNLGSLDKPSEAREDHPFDSMDAG